MRAILPVLAGLASLMAQNAPPKGAIHGVVRDTLTGSPLAGVVVTAGAVSAVSDAQGNYSLRDLPAGEVRVAVTGGMAKSTGRKSVEVGAGKDVVLDLPVQAQGRISGAVLDADGKPVGGARVMLLVREYSLGALRYVLSYGTFTNDRGEYGGAAGPLGFATIGGDVTIAQGLSEAIQSLNSLAAAAGPNRNQPPRAAIPEGIPVEAGRGYLLVATKGRPMLRPPEEEGQDPAARKIVPQTTWYIASKSPDGALPVILSPAERRERVDIRMAAGPSYCMVGTLHAGDTPGGWLDAAFSEAPLAVAGVGGMVRFRRSLPEKDTKLGFCGFVPGEYRLAVSRSAEQGQFPQSYGSQLVTIVDKDITVPFDGLPPVRLAGEVVWDALPRPDPSGGEVTVRLLPLTHASFPNESFSAKAPVGGAFALDRLVADDYEVQVTGIPPGAYLKDVTFGGHSILHAPLHAGSANLLRVILARDGGSITAQVSDADGNPVADAWVVAMPAAAGSEAALADAMVCGQSDAAGVWNGPPLAPGKYLVLASLAPVDHSLEAVGRLYRARGSAQEAAVGPGAAVPVKLAPLRLR